MVEEVEKTIEQQKNLGYSSISEFVKDAIRRRFEDIRRYSTREETRRPH